MPVTTPRGIGAQIIKPTDCVMAFGIPTSEAAFLRNGDYAQGFRGDWETYEREVIAPLEKVRPKLAGLGVTILENVTFEQFGQLFHSQYLMIVFISHLKSGKQDPAHAFKEKLSPLIKPNGVTNTIFRVHGFNPQGHQVVTLEREAYSLPPRTALQLEAHLEDRIEFFDGLAGASAVVSQVPKDFALVLDLCLCNAGNTVIELVSTHPNGFVRHTHAGVTPKFWLYFYLALFTHLHAKERTYLQALPEVKAEFDKQAGTPHLHLPTAKAAIKAFTARVGQSMVNLGGKRQVEVQDLAAFLEDLAALRKKNKAARIAWGSLLLIFYSVAAISLVWSQGQVKGSYIVVCGILTAIVSLVVGSRLRRLGREEAILDLFRAACLSHRFSPTKAADLMADFYPYL